MLAPHFRGLSSLLALRTRVSKPSRESSCEGHQNTRVSSIDTARFRADSSPCLNGRDNARSVCRSHPKGPTAHRPALAIAAASCATLRPAASKCGPKSTSPSSPQLTSVTCGRRTRIDNKPSTWRLAQSMCSTHPATLLALVWRAEEPRSVTGLLRCARNNGLETWLTEGMVILVIWYASRLASIPRSHRQVLTHKSRERRGGETSVRWGWGIGRGGFRGNASR